VKKDLPSHPTQPVIKDEHGTLRFRANEIVCRLFARDGSDLDRIAKLDASPEDHVQFAQLLGLAVDDPRFDTMRDVLPALGAPTDPHPMQPVHVDTHGTIRFRKNVIVEALVDRDEERGRVYPDFPARSDGGLNWVGMQDFAQEDEAQLAQLIGYSVSGYHELSYVSDESAAKASELAREILPEAGGCRDVGCEIHGGSMPSYEEALALSRQGGLSRPTFGKPRGTRTEAAVARMPVPGHYYRNTTAEFIVPDKPLQLDVYLLMMCTSVDKKTRVVAAHVIGEFGDASCVPMLITALCPEGSAVLDEDTRCSAAHALASIGGPEAEESLWRALESGTCPSRVKEAALMGLLDMLTPDGWENYTFMNSTMASLPVDIRERLLKLRDLPYGRILYIDNIVSMFEAPSPEVLP
jgi:hypothetical protein